ncbi:hypothetical protein BGX26_010017 [Mortierella sp. AD094]|nr:hypothetical protein BGX26_010017 [Mortierella sp. AD094]
MMDISPFDIPEIRHLIGRFLSKSDAITCSLVCRAWQQDFTSEVWRHVICTTTRFLQLDPQLVSKHGHRIRVVDDLEESTSPVVLHDSSVKSLKILKMCLPESPSARLGTLDLIRRNNSTLVELAISDFEGIQLFGTYDSLGLRYGYFGFVDVLIPRTYPYVSNITKLSLTSLLMTRESFSFLLSGCPQLNRLELNSCMIQHIDNADVFKNIHVRDLLASVENTRCEGSSSSILEHFPNLKRWDTYSDADFLGRSIADAVRPELMMHCPGVIEASTIECMDANVTTLLTRIFVSLKSIYLEREVINQEILFGLLCHKDSLEYCHVDTAKVFIWIYERDLPPIVEQNGDGDDMETAGQSHAIYTLAMNCLYLKHLILPLLEMDMDRIEALSWACKGLKELRVGIRGLDTKESIIGVKEAWQKGQTARKRGRVSETEAIIRGCNSTSIKDRVE